MSFFGDKKRTESVVLIDIGTGSVAGAYVLFTEGESPTLLYTRRLPIEVRQSEPHEAAMLRALGILGNVLIQEGAPVLLRYTGSGSAETVLVSVDAPWQKTSVRTEHLEQQTPFIFTKSLVTSVLKKTRVTPAGQLLADESIIGTILNGYETHDPYGKEARRASLVILTSLIDEAAANGIHSTLRGLFHTKNILSIAGSSLRYQALRIAFPHERDALILDATEPLTSFTLVRRDFLMDVTEVQSGTNDAALWIQKVSEAFAEVATRFPLPRTMFLLAREADSEALRAALDAADLTKLWLSDNPPKIVSILASHLSGLVRQATTAAPDLSLMLITLYFQHRPPGE